MENRPERMETVNGKADGRRLLPEILKADIEKYNREAEECAGVIAKLRELFEHGSVKIGEDFLSLDNLAICVQYVTAIYSRATLLWGDIRGRSNAAEMRRKFRDTALFGQLKQYAGEKNKGAARFTQKDIESVVATKNEGAYQLEQEWNLLYAKIGACKDVLETYLTSLDLIYKTSRMEWRATK